MLLKSNTFKVLTKAIDKMCVCVLFTYVRYMSLYIFYYVYSLSLCVYQREGEGRERKQLLSSAHTHSGYIHHWFLSPRRFLPTSWPSGGPRRRLWQKILASESPSALPLHGWGSWYVHSYWEICLDKFFFSSIMNYKQKHTLCQCSSCITHITHNTAMLFSQIHGICT